MEVEATGEGFVYVPSESIVWRFHNELPSNRGNNNDGVSIYPSSRSVYNKLGRFGSF